MKLTAANYANESKNLDFSKLKGDFADGHAFTLKAAKYYGKKESITTAIDTYLKKLNAEVAKSKPAAKSFSGKPKTYNISYNVGSTKYLVNYHDGVKTHKDGSPFNDAANFSNKRKMEAFVKDLEKQGYKKEGLGSGENKPAAKSNGLTFAQIKELAKSYGKGWKASERKLTPRHGTVAEYFAVIYKWTSNGEIQKDVFKRDSLRESDQYKKLSPDDWPRIYQIGKTKPAAKQEVKVHYYPYQMAHKKSLCGIDFNNLQDQTSEPTEVTCKNCIKLMDNHIAAAKQEDKLSINAQNFLAVITLKEKNNQPPYQSSFTARKGSNQHDTDLAINELAKHGFVKIMKPVNGFSKIELLKPSTRIEAKKAKKDLTYDQWESHIITAIIAKMQVSNSDAQALLERQTFYASQAWGKGLAPKEAYEYIAHKAGWDKNEDTKPPKGFTGPKGKVDFDKNMVGKIVRVNAELFFVTGYENERYHAVFLQDEGNKLSGKESSIIYDQMEVTSIKPKPSWLQYLSGDFKLADVAKLSNYKYKSVKPVPYKLVPGDKGLAKLFKKFLVKDDLRPAMQNLNFDEDGVTATDAHLLLHVGGKVAKKNWGVRGLDGKKTKFITPAERTALHEKGLSKKQKMPDGFPNYLAVIPTDNPNEFKVDPAELYNYANMLVKSRMGNPVSEEVSMRYTNRANSDYIGLNAKLLSHVCEAMLMLGGNDWYVQMSEPNRAAVFINKKGTISPKDDTYALQMPVMLTDASIAGLGVHVQDFNRVIDAYWDFEKNTLIEDGKPVSLKQLLAGGGAKVEKDKTSPRFKVSDRIIPYAIGAKRGVFVIDEVYRNQANEVSYKGKFEESGEKWDIIEHSKDKLATATKKTTTGTAPTNPATIGSFTVADLADGRVVVLGVRGNETPHFKPIGGHLQPNGRGLDGKKARTFVFPKGKRKEVEEVLRGLKDKPMPTETIADIRKELAVWGKENNPDSMSQQTVLGFAKRVNALRNAGGRTRDANKTGKKVLEPTYKNLLRWTKYPGRYDMQGIDAPASAKATVTARVGALDKFFSQFGINF